MHYCLEENNLSLKEISRLSAGIKIHDFQKLFWNTCTAIAGCIYILFSLDKHFVLFVYALTQNHVVTPTIVKHLVFRRK